MSDRLEDCKRCGIPINLHNACLSDRSHCLRCFVDIEAEKEALVKRKAAALDIVLNHPEVSITRIKIDPKREKAIYHKILKTIEDIEALEVE